MLKDAGYEEVVLGNLYKGGCTLETHASNFQKNNGAEYTYYRNTTGTWTEMAPYAPLDALKDCSWDYVTLQQGSPVSGQPDTFDPYLGTMIDIISLWEGPDDYVQCHRRCRKDQDIDQQQFFQGKIPNGTAVQNMRTSYVGDNLTRDGYHMSYSYGRYLTALTFAKALTGCDLSEVTYVPPGQSFTEKDLLAMKDAADKAIADPYVVTPSEYAADFDYKTASFEQILEYEGQVCLLILLTTRVFIIRPIM